ncbi:LysR family transcriptional regulator [Sphingopyxis sp. RIFCSPHIGHO2_12_FULL_65_19]|uniref:LysR family transcriptional regulator n=1 Tax=Sphingopyxis sp. RIFCSPHIGHO2_12_FULL_65_19 TaxID=1802172 RepID=UPI0008B9DBE7|nr:LysR family transcriptional regulator [Sphingopyxis sp. RIFCSPHIGHO2_12_FULL_65_19]OHD06275.1 MAG: LysR family transcriptional regulator [Sphingopyxis sp. RIFCSPHIGHO2_12_FULL_65_19]
MSRLALRDFDAVLAVARRTSFRQAAIDLGMSTTALSHMIARIEAELGVRLFNRTTRSVALTDAGRIFVDRLGPSLQDVREAIEIVRERRATPAGTLRINAPPFAARSPAFTDLLLEYSRRYPDMHVDLVTEGLLRDIVAEGFDLGVRVASLIPSDMIALSLGELQRFAVVASPAYLAGRPRPLVPTDLHSHACIRIRLPDGSLYRWHFEKGGDTAQVEVSGSMTFDELALSRATVLSDFGIGFFFEQDVVADIKDGRLVRLLEDWTPSFPGLSLYYPGRRHPSAGLAAFLALARERASATRVRTH